MKAKIKAMAFGAAEDRPALKSTRTLVLLMVAWCSLGLAASWGSAEAKLHSSSVAAAGCAGGAAVNVGCTDDGREPLSIAKGSLAAGCGGANADCCCPRDWGVMDCDPEPEA